MKYKNLFEIFCVLYSATPQPSAFSQSFATSSNPPSFPPAVRAQHLSDDNISGRGCWTFPLGTFLPRPPDIQMEQQGEGGPANGYYPLAVHTLGAILFVQEVWDFLHAIDITGMDYHNRKMYLLWCPMPGNQRFIRTVPLIYQVSRTAAKKIISPPPDSPFTIPP